MQDLVEGDQALPWVGSWEYISADITQQQIDAWCSMYPSPSFAGGPVSTGERVPFPSVIDTDEDVPISLAFEQAFEYESSSAKGGSASTREATEQVASLLGVTVKTEGGERFLTDEQTLSHLQKLQDTVELRISAKNKLDSQASLRAPRSDRDRSTDGRAMNSNDWHPCYLTKEEQETLDAPLLWERTPKDDAALLDSAMSKLAFQSKVLPKGIKLTSKVQGPSAEQKAGGADKSQSEEKEQSGRNTQKSKKGKGKQKESGKREEEDDQRGRSEAEKER
jgi:hypothetical protein